ncbi:hypothetical protein [uncultured Jatrophihabitans sp.]|uniref:hypothetical protein n=1 Tax=uncultured Jatrophihabitans sp. TaxID=1610747 RepID=UPI0035CC069D
MTGLALATVLLCTAAGSFGLPAAAAPYPPTPPCDLSWLQNGAHDDVLVGSGYEVNQLVAVTLYPQAQNLGSYSANSEGIFTAPVHVLDTGPSSFVTARSVHRSCSVVPPSGGTTSSPAPTAPTSSSGAPGTGAGPTGNSNSAGPSGSDSPPGGASTSEPGSAASSGATRPPDTTTPDTTTPDTTTPDSTTPDSTAPASTTPTSATTSGPGTGSTTSPAPNADVRNPSGLALPLRIIVIIAALLLLAGGLGVVFLTRRAD